jgi:hypothetical protein
MINVELLRKTLEHITAHPEEHDQTQWAVKTDGCGTAYCLAGHAVQLAGHTIRWRAAKDWKRTGLRVVACDVEDGRFISDVATQELGLSSIQAADLFSANNDIGTLWRLASDYTNGAIEIPERFA